MVRKKKRVNYRVRFNYANQRGTSDRVGGGNKKKKKTVIRGRAISAQSSAIAEIQAETRRKMTVSVRGKRENKGENVEKRKRS